MYDPTNGEAVLPDSFYNDLHNTPTTGGSDSAAQQWAYLDFQKQFGRNPTQSELNSLAPSYSTGDTNKLDLSRGKQTVAQYFQNFSNTPDQINKTNQDKYLKEAPQHFDAVNQVFQSQLGRAASQDELNHFGSAIASGSMDPYQLQGFIQQQPEFTQKQDASFRSGLSDELAGYDKQTLEKNLLPAIQANFSKQGRSVESSGFASAAASAAENQTVDRGKYIAGLSATQYQGSRERAYQDYANQVQQSQNLTNSGINATYQGNRDLNTRLNSISDFNSQQQAYNQYLARYGKRGGWMDDLGTSLNFANSFANLFKNGAGQSSGSQKTTTPSPNGSY